MVSGGDKLAVFHRIYTPEVLSNIANKAKRDDGLKKLYQMLVAANEHRRIERVHFDKCLDFAKEHGGLDNDRLRRLVSPDSYATWRATYNELLVPYFFAKTFKLKIKFISDAKEKGTGDFQIRQPDGIIVVEVKTPKGDAPNLEGPKESNHMGLDEHLIRSVFLDATRKLHKGNKNLLVICIQLCTWVHSPDTFDKFFYGQLIITPQNDPNTGSFVGPGTTKFLPNGVFNKHTPKRFTRVSAVASFNSAHYMSAPSSEKTRQIQFSLFHNYYALCPLTPDLFTGVEQFIPNREKESIDHLNKEKNLFLIEV